MKPDHLDQGGAGRKSNVTTYRIAKTRVRYLVKTLIMLADGRYEYSKQPGLAKGGEMGTCTPSPVYTASGYDEYQKPTRFTCMIRYTFSNQHEHAPL